MESKENKTPNQEHLEKIRADIDADRARIDELKKRIKGRTILGLALPGATALKDELHRTEMAWRFSVAEESSTMAETSLDIGARAASIDVVSGGEKKSDPFEATIEPRDPTESPESE